MAVISSTPLWMPNCTCRDTEQIGMIAVQLMKADAPSVIPKASQTVRAE